MLYQTKTGSSNGKPTMVKNGDPTGSVELGNKDYFSAKDLLRINKLYGCSEQFIDSKCVSFKKFVVIMFGGYFHIVWVGVCR